MNNITRRQALLACLAVGILGAWVAWTYRRAVHSPALDGLANLRNQMIATETVRNAGMAAYMVRFRADSYMRRHDGQLPDDATVLAWVREVTAKWRPIDPKSPPFPPPSMRPGGGIELVHCVLHVSSARLVAERDRDAVVFVLFPPGDPTGAVCAVSARNRPPPSLVGGAAFQGRTWSEVSADLVDFEPAWPQALDVVRTARFVPYDDVAYSWSGALKQLAGEQSQPSDDLKAAKEPR